jgi:4-hydroxy-4-methyl-2-oxoglutarate aldolase
VSDVNVGFRVYTEARRPAPEVVDGFRAAATPNIGDAMHGITVVDSGIRPVWDGPRFLGPATTVVLSPGDGLMARKAIDLAQPGDVLVMNSFGATERAVLGGSVAIAAARRGIVGVVIDGAVRDVGEIAEVGLPVMARSVTPRSGSTPHGWGEVNVPVAIGGVVVGAGDIVVGDREGIVVVPAEHAAQVLATYQKVAEKKGRPEQMRERIAAQQQGPVRGMDRTGKAMQDRGATVIEGAFA